MNDVFISYASEDRAIAQQLALGLEQEGLSVWWDRNIQVGTEWDKTIEAALGAAKCVVVLWTQHAKDSRWVRAEAREALKKNTVLPVMLAPDSIPLAFTGIQALKLLSWDGSRETEEFALSLSVIRAKLTGNPVKMPEFSSTKINWIGKVVAALGVKTVGVAMVIGFLTVSALWPITPDIVVTLQTTRMVFAVNPGQEAKRLTDDLSFDELTLQNVGKVSLSPDELFVADPKKYNFEEDSYPPTAWHELSNNGGVVTFEYETSEVRPEETVLSVEGDKPVAGTLDKIILTKEAEVTLEVKNDNSMTISIRTESEQQRVVLSELRAVELIENGLIIQKDVDVPFSQNQELTYQALFKAKSGKMEIMGLKNAFILVVREIGTQKKDVFSDTVLPIQSVDFSWQDPATGERKSPEGFKGTIQYRDPEGMSEVNIEKNSYLTLDDLEHFEITSISLDRTNHVLAVDLHGKAGYVKSGTAGNPRDHRPTLFDKIRLSPLFEPIRSLIKLVV